MGCSCIDVEELSKEGKRFLSRVAPYMNDSHFNRIVNSKSLEQMDKEIEEYRSLLNKLRRMSSFDYKKQHQIEISGIYINTKLRMLENLRSAKLYFIKARENEIKIEQLKRAIINLYSIFPKNYFLPKKRRKDNFIPSDWENLDFNLNREYEFNNNEYLSINNNSNEWVKAFHGTGRNCKSNNEIFNTVDSIIKNGFKNGINNAHANCDDKYHPGRKIGNSVYVTPNISTAISYS